MCNYRQSLCLFAVGFTLCATAHAGPLAALLRERRSAPPAAAAPARVLHDLAYGPAVRQKLDVYFPETAAPGRPILFIVHGGAWAVGDKAASGLLENKLARWLPRGFIVVSSNYRMLPQAAPDQQAADIAAALAFVQQRAAGWGGDAHQLVLLGHSAGAHLVALLSATPALADAAGVGSWLGTIALDSAAYDITSIMERRHAQFYDQAFGSDPQYWRATSPLLQLQRRTVPFLAVCSSQRPDQPCQQAQAFVHKAQGAGGVAQLLPQDLSHSEINERLGAASAYTDAVEDFMASLSPLLRQALRE